MDLGSGETRVIDYKFTGSASYSGGSLARDSARGKKLQPAAYMLMAAGRAPMDTPVTFQFHVLWPGGEDRVKKISLEPDFWQTAEGMSTGKALAAILDGIRRGEFFINPEAPDNLCRSCSFDGLCRRFHRPTRYRLAADSRSRVLSEKIDHGSKGDRDG
jgi:ATP-dependent helicase/nuclease subunit B